MFKPIRTTMPPTRKSHMSAEYMTEREMVSTTLRKLASITTLIKKVVNRLLTLSTASAH